eukprot:GHVT01038845.1.p1 GENE.GHVT01038845.1~~GHVT01038845.1.p1  ORF type:complete len:935 (-),score=209.00 GHVT01038845.1:7859-10663(-)
MASVPAMETAGEAAGAEAAALRGRQTAAEDGQTQGEKAERPPATEKDSAPSGPQPSDVNRAEELQEAGADDLVTPCDFAPRSPEFSFKDSSINCVELNSDGARGVERVEANDASQTARLHGPTGFSAALVAGSHAQLGTNHDSHEASEGSTPKAHRRLSAENDQPASEPVCAAVEGRLQGSASEEAVAGTKDNAHMSPRDRRGNATPNERAQGGVTAKEEELKGSLRSLSRTSLCEMIIRMSRAEALLRSELSTLCARRSRLHAVAATSLAKLDPMLTSATTLLPHVSRRNTLQTFNRRQRPIPFLIQAFRERYGQQASAAVSSALSRIAARDEEAPVSCPPPPVRRLSAAAAASAWASPLSMHFDRDPAGLAAPTPLSSHAGPAHSRLGPRTGPAAHANLPQVQRAASSPAAVPESFLRRAAPPPDAVDQNGSWIHCAQPVAAETTDATNTTYTTNTTRSSSHTSTRDHPRAPWGATGSSPPDSSPQSPPCAAPSWSPFPPSLSGSWSDFSSSPPAETAGPSASDVGPALYKRLEEAQVLAARVGDSLHRWLGSKAAPGAQSTVAVNEHIGELGQRSIFNSWPTQSGAASDDDASRTFERRPALPLGAGKAQFPHAAHRPRREGGAAVLPPHPLAAMWAAPLSATSPSLPGARRASDGSAPLLFGRSRPQRAPAPVVTAARHQNATGSRSFLPAAARLLAAPGEAAQTANAALAPPTGRPPDCQALNSTAAPPATGDHPPSASPPCAAAVAGEGKAPSASPQVCAGLAEAEAAPGGGKLNVPGFEPASGAQAEDVEEEVDDEALIFASIRVVEGEAPLSLEVSATAQCCEVAEEWVDSHWTTLQQHWRTNMRNVGKTRPTGRGGRLSPQRSASGKLAAAATTSATVNGFLTRSAAIQALTSFLQRVEAEADVLPVKADTNWTQILSERNLVPN